MQTTGEILHKKGIQGRSIISKAMKKKMIKEVGFYYKSKGRDLPWRQTKQSYRILVSEIMLQQTQVSRVVEKYKEFIKVFPNFKTLAQAPQAQVLAVWSGLGYNRRALMLHRTAQIVEKAFHGRLPRTVEELVQLPGIGLNTAGAIMAYAFNIPVPFIETNVRSVYLHFFFPQSQEVSDKELLPLVEQTMDYDNPREWYWALMDYGSILKQSGNPNQRSTHYVKQSKFQGSNRQVRGQVLKLLLKSPHTQQSLCKYLASTPEKLKPIVLKLEAEGFIAKHKLKYHLS